MTDDDGPVPPSADALDDTRANGRRPVTDLVGELQARADAAIADGAPAGATRASLLLASVLHADGDRVGALAALRRAVASARRIRGEDPGLYLHALTSLAVHLRPSAEAASLAEESAATMVIRDDIYQPARAAEAMQLWALVELDRARHHQVPFDTTAGQLAALTLRMLDAECLHESARSVRRATAQALRAVGRDTEAAEHDRADSPGGVCDECGRR